MKSMSCAAFWRNIRMMMEMTTYIPGFRGWYYAHSRTAQRTRGAWMLRTYPVRSVDFASTPSERRLTAVAATTAAATVIRQCDVIATSSRDVIDSDGLRDDVDRHVTWMDAPIMARSAAVCGFLLAIVAALTTGNCALLSPSSVYRINSNGVFRSIFL